MLLTEKNIKQFRAFHRKKLNLIEIARPIYCQVMCRLKKELRILCDLWNTAGKHVSSCLCIFCCWNNVFSWQRKAIISGITQFNGIRVFDANAFSIIIRSTCCCIQNNSSCTNGILFGFQFIDFLWKQRNCGILIISSLRAGSFAFGSYNSRKRKKCSPARLLCQLRPSLCDLGEGEHCTNKKVSLLSTVRINNL